MASELELMNPLTALGLTRIGGPAGASLVPDELASVFGQIFRRSGDKDETMTDRAAETERVAKLEAAVADLSRTVETQNRTIESMRSSGAAEKAKPAGPPKVQPKRKKGRGNG